jgi:hypothetical protein
MDKTKLHDMITIIDNNITIIINAKERFFFINVHYTYIFHTSNTLYQYT